MIIFTLSEVPFPYGDDCYERQLRAATGYLNRIEQAKRLVYNSCHHNPTFTRRVITIRSRQRSTASAVLPLPLAYAFPMLPLHSSSSHQTQSGFPCRSPAC